MSPIILGVVMLGCRYAGCRYAGCRYAGCHYAGCRYAESRGFSINLLMVKTPVTIALTFLLSLSTFRDKKHIKNARVNDP